MFAILVLSLLFAMVSGMDELNLLNLRPPLYYGFGRVIKSAASDASKIIEIAVLGVFANKITGGIKKTVITFLLSFWAAVSFLAFLLASILGEYGAEQIFPVYQKVSLAKIGTFRRFDAILTAVWIVGDLIKASYLLIAASDSMKYVFSGRAHKIAMAVNVAGIVTVGAFFSYSLKRYFELSNLILIGTVSVTANVLIPLLVLVIDLIKNRKGEIRVEKNPS